MSDEEKNENKNTNDDEHKDKNKNENERRATVAGFAADGALRVTTAPGGMGQYFVSFLTDKWRDCREVFVTLQAYCEL